MIFCPLVFLTRVNYRSILGSCIFWLILWKKTTNRARTFEVNPESISMKTSAQNHDGVVQRLDIFAEKETIEKHRFDSVMRSVMENRKLTGEEAIKTRISEIHNLLQGIHLTTKLVDISPTQPLFESFNGKRLSIGELSSGEKQFYYQAALLNKLSPHSSSPVDRRT